MYRDRLVKILMTLALLVTTAILVGIIVYIFKESMGLDAPFFEPNPGVNSAMITESKVMLCLL